MRLLPETNSSRDELDESSRFVHGADVGVYMSRVSRGRLACGRGHIKIIRSDGKTGHCVGFIWISYGLLYHRIFVFKMTYFI